MEELRAQERAAYQHVSELMKPGNATPDVVNHAFQQYRSLCLQSMLAAFPDNRRLEDRMWQLHSEGRRYFSSALRKLRKSEAELPVETRKMMKEYLRWIKDSESSYRDLIASILQLCHGLPQFDIIAHRLNIVVSSESQQPHLLDEHYEVALNMVHRSLVYLGDLSRYRATEKLDKEPRFGPALGFYDMADATIPKSGLGHHQQAIIPRESKNHLHAIYHFYRSICVELPHALGLQNLNLEFGKVDAALAKHELIQKGSPKDQDAPHRALVGFFVQMHSMCYKGLPFPAHQELEREILGHLSHVVKQCSFPKTVMRVVITNIAAQHIASQRLEKEESTECVQSVYFFLQFNLTTFTTLLRIFYDDLLAKVANMDHANTELADKITPLARSLLPIIQVYHRWLNNEVIINVLDGLASDTNMAKYIKDFWVIYAKTIDLVAQAFPVWDLDDVPEIGYMLEEDVNTLAFLPLLSERTRKIWYWKQNGVQKNRFFDLGVKQLSEDEEMLCRIRSLLNDGTDLAIYLEKQYPAAPFKLHTTRFYTGTQENIEELVVKPVEYKPPPKLSYAAMAAAAAKAKQQRPAPAQAAAPVKAPVRDAQAAQMSRMVDDLVDDDDGNHPVTPPQQAASNPAVVSNGELPHVLQDSVHDLAGSKTPVNHNKSPLARGARLDAPRSPYGVRPGSNSGNHAYYDPMQGVSRIWDTYHQPPQSSFSSGLPVGTLGSPAMVAPRGHSRVNSASSIRSRSSLNAKDPWAAADAAPRTLPEASNTVYGAQSSLDQIGMTSPQLLFGAGQSAWSPGLRNGYHGQGG